MQQVLVNNEILTSVKQTAGEVAIYSVVESLCYERDLGYYHSFGICCKVFYDGGIMSANLIHDISTSKSKVKKLVKMFNRNILSPTHLTEAVEDFLVENA